jgi:hypothetical protein
MFLCAEQSKNRLWFRRAGGAAACTIAAMVVDVPSRDPGAGLNGKLGGGEQSFSEADAIAEIAPVAVARSGTLARLPAHCASAPFEWVAHPASSAHLGADATWSGGTKWPRSIKIA